MLQPLCETGSRPPFFLVHGLHGLIPLADAMARAQGLDQPFYLLNARGYDGAVPPPHSVAEMTAEYITEIRQARPHGPYVLGGFCSGGMAALEIARALAADGEPVGTVLLLDPPAIPFGFYEENRTFKPAENPAVLRQLFMNVKQVLEGYAAKGFTLPFDPRDPQQLETACRVGVATTVAFYQYVPPVFDGPTEFIICAQRALGHFYPESRWRQITGGTCKVHVLPGEHYDLFRGQFAEMTRLMKFALDGAFPR